MYDSGIKQWSNHAGYGGGCQFEQVYQHDTYSGRKQWYSIKRIAS